MKQVDVLSIGYACWDLNFQVCHHPAPDEKIRAQTLISEGGGPAANAAIGVARLGGSVAFAGRLGNDPFGEAHLKELKEAGVNTDCIFRSDAPTPVASVSVKPNGERSVITFSEKRESIDFDFGPLQPACLLTDGHEWEASEKALRNFKNEPSVLDAGSLTDSTKALAKKVTHLIASTVFAESASQSQDPTDWMKCLAGLAPFIAVTRGAMGIYWSNDSGIHGHLKALPVKAVDTTGAGDLFHGAFAWALSQEKPFPAALSWANQVASCSVQKAGGRSSFPTRVDIPALAEYSR